MRATVLLALLVALVPGPAGLAGATVGDGAADDPSPLLSGASGAAAEGGGGAAPPTDPPASPALSGLRSSEVLGIREAAVTDRERATHWGWPLAGVPEVARGFDPPAQRWGAGHRGIDLVGVVGEPVLSTEAGVVTYSGVVAGAGVVSVTHPDGLRSTYQPVADRVGRGDRVARGDRLGSLDSGGHCLTRDCLHLGAIRGRDTYVDPTPLLLEVDLTLLPIGR